MMPRLYLKPGSRCASFGTHVVARIGYCDRCGDMVQYCQECDAQASTCACGRYQAKLTDTP
jgi:hypothetical protein